MRHFSIAMSILVLTVGLFLPLTANSGECEASHIQKFFEASASQDFELAWLQFSPAQQHFPSKAAYINWAKAKAQKLLEQVDGPVEQSVQVAIYEYEEPCLFAVSVAIATRTLKMKVLDFLEFKALLDKEGIVELKLTGRLPSIIEEVWQGT